MNEEIKYCIYSSVTGIWHWRSLRGLRKGCISDFIKKTNMTWDQTKAYGWECHKVTVTIKKVEN